MDYTISNSVEWLPNEGWDPRLHIAANADLVNVFALITERAVILVDTLLNEVTAEALVDHIQSYLAGRQLLIINSHSDWDHAWGNQLFAGPNARYPAPIIAHANASVEYNQADNLDLLAKVRVTRPEIFGEVVLTPPTLTFADDLWINGGDLTLHLFPTPGHRPDHIAIYIPEIGTLLAGDAAEIPFPMLQSSADLPVLRASLARMAAFDAPSVFYCHAPPTIGPQLLHDNIAYYDALEAVGRAALANGLDADAVATRDLPAALNCHFEEVTPTTGAWAEVSAYARTVRHAQQMRLMLAWLQGKEVVIQEDEDE